MPNFLGADITSVADAPKPSSKTQWTVGVQSSRRLTGWVFACVLRFEFGPLYYINLLLLFGGVYENLMYGGVFSCIHLLFIILAFILFVLICTFILF